MFQMVETLGEAWSLSWRVFVRCLDDGREGLKHKRTCGYQKHLDMETLVVTRGRGYPIARVAQVLRCPRCGCREMSVMFDPPANHQTNPHAVRSYRLQRLINESDD